MVKVTRKEGDGKRRIQKLIRDLQTQHIRVGFLESSVYESGVPLAYVAAIHEYGCAEKNIPPRPIFAPTIAKYGGEWQSDMRKLGKQVLEGALTSELMLRQIGEVAAGNVAETIAATTSPPLAPGTVQNRKWKHKKGYDVGDYEKPLQESNYMLEEVQPGVVTNGKG